jgi:lipopolysaccharide transport system ATP-binding protein
VTSPLVRVDGLGKRFRRYPAKRPRSIVQAMLGARSRGREDGHFWVFRNLDFEVMPGEMLGIVGRNGCGKSTLLTLLAGLMRPDEGGVLVRGKVSALLDLGRSLHPQLSGRENIRSAGIMNGMTRRQVEDQMEEIVEFSELGSFLGAPVRTYSSGMKARLAFSVAVHAQPRILLVDEFLFVGDQFFQAKCLARIQELMGQGAAVLLTSHIEQKISDHCGRALWLGESGVRALGDPRRVLDAYQADQEGQREATRRRLR